MFRSSAILVLSGVMLAAGCGEGTPDASLVSGAVAAPVQAVPDSGWRSSVSADAETDTAYEYR